MTDPVVAPELPQKLPAPDIEKSELDFLRKRLSEIETSLGVGQLDQEGKLRDAVISERLQRNYIRLGAFVLAALVLTAMFWVLAHAMHSIFWGHFLSVPRAYAIAAIVAPIASITTITALLMIGSFRGFKENEMKIDSVSLADAIRTSVGSSS